MTSLEPITLYWLVAIALSFTALVIVPVSKGGWLFNILGSLALAVIAGMFLWPVCIWAAWQYLTGKVKPVVEEKKSALRMDRRL